MKTTTVVVVLSWIVKLAGIVGALNAIPGVSPSAGVIIFFCASLLKDTAQRIEDFLAPTTVTKAVATLAVLCLASATMVLTGCATTQTASTSTTQTLINDAWTAANNLQTANNGQLITPAAQTTALSLSHNSGDAAYASVVASLFNQVVGAQVAAQAAKVSPVAATNAVLAPANVAATAASIAASNP